MEKRSSGKGGKAFGKVVLNVSAKPPKRSFSASPSLPFAVSPEEEE